MTDQMCWCETYRIRIRNRYRRRKIHGNHSSRVEVGSTKKAAPRTRELEQLIYKLLACRFHQSAAVPTTLFGNVTG